MYLLMPVSTISHQLSFIFWIQMYWLVCLFVFNSTSSEILKPELRKKNRMCKRYFTFHFTFLHKTYIYILYDSLLSSKAYMVLFLTFFYCTYVSFAGIRVCGSTQCLHDPHASCAKLWHHQVPLKWAVPCLPQDA